jgi:hypothetical protein
LGFLSLPIFDISNNFVIARHQQTTYHVKQVVRSAFSVSDTRDLTVLWPLWALPAALKSLVLGAATAEQQQQTDHSMLQLHGVWCERELREHNSNSNAPRAHRKLS